MNTTTANWSNIESCQPMSSAATHQREAATSQFFATIARRRQALRQTLRTLTAPHIYRMELKAARRMAQAVDQHHTLSNACLWVMGFTLMIEIFLNT